MSIDKQAPLAGLRVLDFGHYISGPLAGRFLADQGAEVLHIVNPNRLPWDVNTERMLSCGKHVLELDLKNEQQLQTAIQLASTCDILLENFRPGVMDRLGLGHESVRKNNPAVIYVSMPGFSRHDQRAQQAAWDGTINAACGLYTDISIGGAAVDLPPTYTPLSIPSVYTGIWGAIAAVAALYARQQHGHGDRIEVPMLDGAMSAAAGVIFQVVNQAARYNAPPLSRKILDKISLRHAPNWLSAMVHRITDRNLPPFFRNYVCGDGCQLFICAIDNSNQIAKLLQATNLVEEVRALGFAFHDVLDIPPSNNNIHAYRGLSKRWKKLKALLAQRFATASAEEWEERLALAGVPAARQRSLEEWVNQKVMHESGVLKRSETGTISPAPQVDLQGARFSTSATKQPAGTEKTSWTEPKAFVPPTIDAPHSPPSQAPLSGLKVIDLANVIAGPSAGRTLAELGADVTHISAVHPRMGPRMNLLMGIEVNQGKTSVALDLHTPEGRDIVHRLIPGSDVLIYNKLPEQAARLGVSPEQVHAINDKTVVGAVTAYSGVNQGGWEGRPAYDPVIQALTGIMQRFGGASTPTLHGIASCIDYFTGYSAAFGVLVGLVARQRGDRRIVARTSLVRTAAWVQLPQLCNLTRATPTGLDALGEVAFDRLYRARDGWVHVGAPPRTKQQLTSTALNALQARLASEISNLQVEDAVVRLREEGMVAQQVLSARHLRRGATWADPGGTLLSSTQASGVINKVQHPAGEVYYAPHPGWLRFDRAQLKRTNVAPTPGQNTVALLKAAGYSHTDIQWLLKAGIVADSWPGLKSYIPE